jgi:periplasmic protein CpxP/Spy
MNAKVIGYTAATAAIAITACVFVPSFFKGDANDSQSKNLSEISPVLAEARPANPQNSQQQEPVMPSGQVLRRLNLSDAQLRQIKAIRETNKTEINSAMQQLQQAQTELQGLMSDSSPSDRVREKFNQIQTLKQKVGQIHFERMLATREILNPTQRAQLVEVLKQRRHERRKF